MPKKIVALTNRDQKIFQFLFEQKVASTKQLATAFFPNLTKQTVSIRLLKLTRSGYLSKYGITNEKGFIHYYGLTKRSLNIVKNNYFYLIDNFRIKSDSVLYDLFLVDIRNQLNRFNMIEEYLTENTLQNCNELSESKTLRPFVDLNSDAYLRIKSPSSTYNVALEYERSLKTNIRYTRKLNQYYRSSKIDGVFYVCESKSILDKIHQIDQKIAKENETKVFGCTKGFIQNNIEQIPFINRDNATFLLS